MLRWLARSLKAAGDASEFPGSSRNIWSRRAVFLRSMREMRIEIPGDIIRTISKEFDKHVEMT